MRLSSYHWSSCLPEPPKLGEKMSSWTPKFPDPVTAFSQCPRADWLVYELASAGPWRVLAPILADCVRSVLPRVPRGDDRSRKAIEVSMDHLEGKASLYQLREAASDLRATEAADLCARAAWLLTRFVQDGDPALASDVAQAIVASAALSLESADAVHRSAEHARLVGRILGNSWPLRLPSPARCMPALQVAWDLAVEQCRVERLTPVQVISGFVAFRELQSVLPDLSAHERETLAGIGERIAGTSEPHALFQQICRVLRAADPHSTAPLLRPRREHWEGWRTQ